MNGGIGQTSYSNTSLLQNKDTSITKTIVEEAMLDLYSTTLPKSLAIADLGCSSGPNTLLVISELMDAVDGKCRQLGRPSPEFQVFLNDLPGNDFNTLFKSLPDFHEKMGKKNGDGHGACFITGVPGSFYGRLFPRESLHFVHSSYSLHWLSQVPQGLDSNKANICMAKTSPPSVLKAYIEQFQSDFSAFLRSRSEELIPGGRMVLKIVGRRSADPSNRECCYIWELLVTALNDMVSEGLIEERKVDTFNLLHYTPSPAEISSVLQREGSFGLDRLETYEEDWNAEDYNVSEGIPLDKFTRGHNLAKFVRAAAESFLVTHFGEPIMDELFWRYGEMLADRMSKEHNKYIDVVVSMTRKRCRQICRTTLKTIMFYWISSPEDTI